MGARIDTSTYANGSFYARNLRAPLKVAHPCSRRSVIVQSTPPSRRCSLPGREVPLHRLPAAIEIHGYALCSRWPLQICSDHQACTRFAKAFRVNGSGTLEGRAIRNVKTSLAAVAYHIAKSSTTLHQNNYCPRENSHKMVLP